MHVATDRAENPAAQTPRHYTPHGTLRSDCRTRPKIRVLRPGREYPRLLKSASADAVDVRGGKFIPRGPCHRLVGCVAEHGGPVGQCVPLVRLAGLDPPAVNRRSWTRPLG